MRAGLLALLGLCALAIGLWEMAGREPVNPALAPATDAAERIAATTAGVYVSLRIINAALSTAQEIEVGASVGAQASVQPFKVLEPVDDTVERVADVVFAVAVGAALATVGFGPVAALGLSLFGAGCLLRAAAGGHWRVSGPAWGMAAAARLMRLGAVLAVVLPLGFAGGVAIGERITAPQWAAALAALDAVTDEARVLIGADLDDPSLPEAASASDGGLFARLSAQLQAAGDGMGEAMASVGRYRAAAVMLMSQADDLLAASLTLIGIFALRTLVLPALLLWAGLGLMRRSAGAD